MKGKFVDRNFRPDSLDVIEQANILRPTSIEKTCGKTKKDTWKFGLRRMLCSVL